MRKLHRINWIDAYKGLKNFSTDPDCPDFGEINLIFGENGTGKTTLTEFLKALKEQKLQEAGNFLITMEDQAINERNYTDELSHIEVFNQHNVEQTIFQSAEGITPIYYIGEEHIEKATMIETLDHEIEAMTNSLKELESNKKDKEKQVNNKLTKTARSVKQMLTAQNSPYNAYNKRNLEKALSKIEEDSSRYLIASDELESMILSIKSSKKSRIEWQPLDLPEASTILDHVSVLLEKKPNAAIMPDIEKDPDLQEWIRQGLAYHEERSKEECLYCGKELNKDLIQAYQEMFNESYNKMHKKITRTIDRINELMKNIEEEKPPEVLLLQEELQPVYKQVREIYGKTLEEYREFLASMNSYLQKKHLQLSNSNLRSELDQVYGDRTKLPAPDHTIAGVIHKHNQIQKEYEEVLNVNRQHIEYHLIAENMPEIRETQEQFENISRKAEEAAKTLHNQQKTREYLQESIYNSRLPAQEMSSDLKEFFPQTNLYIEVAQAGYFIYREGVHAKELSESEKHLISLIYFVRSMTKDQSSLQNKVILLDDPMLALDANRTQSLCCYLENTLKPFLQMFILTHDEDFAKMIRERFRQSFLKDKGTFLLSYFNFSMTASLISLNIGARPSGRLPPP